MQADFIWQNGKLIPFASATTHILSHSLNYGNAVFEGIRGYKISSTTYNIFRLDDHICRLINSAKISNIPLAFDFTTIKNAIIDTCIANIHTFGDKFYIRPILYFESAHLGIYPTNIPTSLAIASFSMDDFLHTEGGLNVKTSSYIRNSNLSVSTKAKNASNYFNAQLAKGEALECGFDEALMLDNLGFVSEGSSECIFIVRDNVLITPPNDNSLESITQDSVLKLAKNLNLQSLRRNITRDEIYIAEEAFFVGTASEIHHISSLDSKLISNGKLGNITSLIAAEYADLVHDKNQNFKEFSTLIKG